MPNKEKLKGRWALAGEITSKNTSNNKDIIDNLLFNEILKFNTTTTIENLDFVTCFVIGKNNTQLKAFIWLKPYNRSGFGIAIDNKNNKYRIIF